MIQWLSLSAKTLSNFPAQEKTERTFPVFLPPDYHNEKNKRFPVVFVLAGFGSKWPSFVTNASTFAPPVLETLSEEMQSGKCPSAILVFPDASTRLGGSQFVNSSTLGHFQDFIADEVVTLVDQTFRTIPKTEKRGVTGHSSGGYGALILGMQRQDVFSHIASLAGDTAFELLYWPLIPKVLPIIEKHRTPEQFLETLFIRNAQFSLKQNQFDALMTCAMAACYAPNPKKPVIWGDLFFDLKTGEIFSEVWARYAAHDPLNLFNKHLDSIKKWQSFDLSAGTEDEYGLQLGHRRLQNLAEAAGIPVTFSEHSGAHGNVSPHYLQKLKSMIVKISSF